MRHRWVWLLALVPVLVGAVAATLAQAGVLSNVVLNVRAALSGVIFGLGAAISLVVLSVLLARTTIQRRHARDMANVRAWATDDRRRFLSRLDHELKNPLTAIRAGLANLNDAPNSTNANADVIGSMEAQTVRLSRLVADLRKLADFQTQPLELSPVNVADLLNEAVVLARERPEAERRRITLTLPRAPWPVPSIRGDYDLLILAVFNLLENAIKYSQPDDAIEVRALEDTSGGVTIEVADTGCGIPEHELPHVFEELYRGERAREAPGSGLGLALVRAVITRHNGTVGVRSRAGQGTVFIVKLPVL